MALASQTVAVVRPIAPASSCMRPSIGLLWILACGRRFAGSGSMRRFISAMFFSTSARSRISAGVGGASRGLPISRRAISRRGSASPMVLEDRAVLELVRRLHALLDDGAGLCEPALLAARPEPEQHPDTGDEPPGADERRPVVRMRRERVERLVERVDEHQAGADREDRVEDPVELAPGLAPVVE